MNEIDIHLLYFDIQILDDSIGRVFIQATSPSKSVDLISFFHGSPMRRNQGAEALATVIQVKSENEIHFEWDSSFAGVGPTSLIFLKECAGVSTAAYAEDAGYLFCDRELTDKFCVTASLWLGNAQTRDKYCIAGRVYKGLSIVNHLASIKVDTTGRPLSECRIVEIGCILPGESLGLKAPHEKLDSCPSSPNDASNVDFKNIDDVIKMAYGIKASASILFREGKFSMAKYKFKKAIRYTSFIAKKRSLERAQEVRMFATIVPCILDCAACKIKMKDYDGALEDCNEALEINPGNQKTYFRRAQVQHAKLNYEKSLRDLEIANNLSPNNKSIQNEIAVVKAEMEIYGKSDRRVANDVEDQSPSMELSDC